MISISVNNIGVKFKLRRSKKNMRSAINAALRDNTLRKIPANNFFWALRSVTFNIEHGELLGIIGKNGSGKSTLLRVISGVYSPDEGNIEVEGKVIMLSIGTSFRKDLTGIENIYLNGVILGFSKMEIDGMLKEISEFSELGDFLYMPLKTYSSGMLARLGFSIAININPDILLIDEALAVGDASFKEKCMDKILRFKREKKTIVLVSHNLEYIAKFCNRTVWLDNGQMRSIGESKKVIGEYLNFVK